MSFYLENIRSKFDQTNEDRANEMKPQLASRLQALTPARVGLRKTGVSLQTNEVLDFQLAHARARDAVHAPLDAQSLISQLRAIGESRVGELRDSDDRAAVLLLHSEAADRSSYLQRPDLGRRLDISSRQRLIEQCSHHEERQRTAESGMRYDLSFVIADGLSALAVERHATPLLTALLPLLARQRPSLRIAPMCVVEQGRVAIGDEIGMLLSAAMVVVLIGERPGLSSPDSLGIYITWLAGSDRSRTDAERNCISNVRAEGLNFVDAAARLWHYIQEARRGGLTGISLKDPEPAAKALSRGDYKW